MNISFSENSIDDIVKSGRLTPYVHFILIAIVSSLLFRAVDLTKLITWAGLVIAIESVRLIFNFSFFISKLPSQKYMFLLSSLYILQGLAWGLGIVYFSEFVSIRHEMFLILIAGGICAAAVVFLSSILILYFLFSLSLLGPTIIYQFSKGDPFSNTLAICCIIYIAVMTMAAISVKHSYLRLQKTKSHLSKQVSLIESIYNSVSDISFITCDMSDDNYKILSYSSASEEIFGLNKEEIIGKPLSDIFNADAYGSCEDMLEKTKSGKPIRGEINLVKGIGLIYNLSFSIYPLLSEKGEVDAALIIATDISQNRHTEEALVDSEEKFRNIIESSPMGMYMYQLDPKGRLVLIEANLAADKITGIDNQKLIGLTLEQAFPGFIETEMPEIYKKVAAKGTSWHTNQIIYKDNKICGTFEIHAFQTSPGKMVAMFTDVADRVNTEKALRKSEERFRDIAFSSSDWIWEFDAAGRFTYLSEGVINVLGYSPSELQGKSFFNLVNPEDAEILRETYILLSSRMQNIVDLESWIVHKYGSLICIQSNGVPIHDSEGNLIGYRGVNKDITEQKRSEERLRQSEERYRTLIETMDEGLVIVNTEEIIIFSNNAACDIFGLPKEKLISSDFSRIVLNHDLSKIYQNIIENRDKGFGKNELTIERLDGQIRHVLISVTQLIDNDGEIFGSFGIFTDVSDLKKAEKEKSELREQLTYAQRMESLGVLAGGVAHDLNNILGPLVAYPDLIKMKLPKDSPILYDISKIQDSAERAAGVVQDLLTLARRGRYDLAPTDLAKIIDSYINSPEFIIMKSKYPNVNLLAQFEDDIPNVVGSEIHLLKIVMNLIVNAMESMPDGGDLTVKLKCEHVEKLVGGFDNIKAGKYIIMSVGDQGLGIDKNDIKRIFEPFFSKKKMGRSGSGLGLAIVYGVVKDHNGYIDIISEINKGSEFVVYFPVVKYKTPVEKKEVVDIRGSEKILIVDDMEEQRELAATILNSLGYDAKPVASGREAVEYLKKESVDVVILDMIMEEGFDGLDTYKEIIKTYPGQKAIIASGFSETDRVREAEKLGVGKYVKKPYNMQILGKAIRDVLSAKETTTV